MIAPDFAAILDAVSDLCPLPTPDVKRDAGLSEPAAVEPNRLYVWPRRIAAAQGATELDIGSFRENTMLEVRILLSLPAKGEPRVPGRDRELSQALLAGAFAIVRALTAHDVYPSGSGSLWQGLTIVDVLPDATRTTKARGYVVDVRLDVPWPDDDAIDDDGSSGGS